jgi:RNase P/RNase MRP subunit p29
MRNSILLALLLSVPLVSATQLGKAHISGTVVGLTDKFVEIKTDQATLLVPKKMVPKEQQKVNAHADVEVAQSEQDQIGLKK